MSLGLLVAAVAISRWVFRSHYLYDLDSVNFALAMKRFDPRVHQPHPPGYFLYIILGRLLNILFHDANLSLVILSILASCGLVAVLYLMTFEWYGLTAARFAGVLFLLSPLGLVSRHRGAHLHRRGFFFRAHRLSLLANHLRRRSVRCTCGRHSGNFGWHQAILSLVSCAPVSVFTPQSHIRAEKSGLRRTWRHCCRMGFANDSRSWRSARLS